MVASEHMNMQISLGFIYSPLFLVQSGQNEPLEMNANKEIELLCVACFCIPHITFLLQEL